MKEVFFILIFFLSWVNADRVTQIDLPIYSCRSCDSGGYQLSIRLKTGTRICKTREKAEFSKGEQLIWSGFELGDCEGFPVDSSTKVHLHTRYNDRYAVQGTMTIRTDSNPYYAEIPNAWRRQEENHRTYHVSQRVLGVKSLLVQNGWTPRNLKLCRGQDVSVKLVNGNEECTVRSKSGRYGNLWESRLATWTRRQLGDCNGFRFNQHTEAYILVNSHKRFCPVFIEVYTDDPEEHKFRLNIAHSVSRVGRFGVFSRETNTRRLHGFTQIYPIPNQGSPRPLPPEVTCPRRVDPNGCPVEHMTAYGVSGHQEMNCAFACSSIKRIPSSFSDYNGSGMQCYQVDYLSPQFKWCCKTKRVHDTIPKCSDAGVRDSEWGTTITNGNEYSTTSDEVEFSSIEPTCPINGCPIENVEKIVDRNSAATSYTACDVGDGCDHVMSGNSSDPNSGISCQRTRRQRHPSKFCCNKPSGSYAGDLPSCSDLRAELRRQQYSNHYQTPQNGQGVNEIDNNSAELSSQSYSNQYQTPQNSQETAFEVNGIDYLLVLDRKTNEEARNHCANTAFGGRSSGKLFEPKDRPTYEQVVENVNRIANEREKSGLRLWVGIQRNQESSQFEYTTSGDALVNGVVTIQSSNDDDDLGEYDDDDDEPSCVEYWMASGNLKVVECAKRRTAICEAV